MLVKVPPRDFLDPHPDTAVSPRRHFPPASDLVRDPDALARRDHARCEVGTGESDESVS
jgi:hypothetical protein